MATILVFDCNGKKELKCFDTLSEVTYLVEEQEEEQLKDNNPFE